ncbi:scavenger mRNA decapping enzyme [Aspergillus coremiiformis]|uniref:Scavenger mRNA decapping enzyme n=1 Tax=Aspergillus coremiiformis TaxID=138285 RepID=A0A5N6ZDI8_9EURO|nr:scavenger mRNA decapping enzyme [Aspergillus coremiiformis]
MADDKDRAEALLPAFHLDKILNHDQAGRRVSLLGHIHTQPAVVVLERAPFPNAIPYLSMVPTTLQWLKNLGANDVYHWYLASSGPGTNEPHPDLKINLFYPATEKHIAKYSAQKVHVVHESPQVYREHIRPFMERQRGNGRLKWMHNIIDGIAETQDVIYRTPVGQNDTEGFVLLPDLNWDRKTLENLHLLGLVERNDIWSVRDLKKKHIGWLRDMKTKISTATLRTYPGLEEDQLKLYVHYQPTYYHLHVHVVHAALEAGTSQAVGKAIGLENIISQLETMAGDDEAGMDLVTLTYTVGEASDLWKEVLEPIGKLNSGPQAPAA